MDFYEFKEYIEENCRAKTIFHEKMTKYFQTQARFSEQKVHLTRSQINSEIRKAWNNALQNLYNNVKTEVKTKRTDAPQIKRIKWINKISELEILDNFTEEIDNAEFD